VREGVADAVIACKHLTLVELTFHDLSVQRHVQQERPDLIVVDLCRLSTSNSSSSSLEAVGSSSSGEISASETSASEWSENEQVANDYGEELRHPDGGPVPAVFAEPESTDPPGHPPASRAQLEALVVRRPHLRSALTYASNCADRYSRTPLHMAILEGDFKLAE
jgi:hypothetical protein